MRFPIAYTVAWLPALASYVVLFIAGRQMTPGRALLAAAVTVIPGALLGAPLWTAVRHRAGRFGAGRLGVGHPVEGGSPAPPISWGRHALYASAYALTWGGAVAALIAVTAPAGAFQNFVRDGLPWQLALGIAAYAVIVALASKGRAEAVAQGHAARAANAEAARVTAELRSLRARLDPHFLFNTLHSIAGLARDDAVGTEKALERFADLLRYVLDLDRQARDQVSLEEELNFVRDYLALEQLRLGSRLKIEEQVSDDALESLIPPLTLQPLVENAIRHGIAPIARGGTVTITGVVEVGNAGDVLVVEVRDDGAGADPNCFRTPDLEVGIGSELGSGLGLPLVDQRLATRYPGTGYLSVHAEPGRGFRATMRLPAVTSS